MEADGVLVITRLSTQNAGNEALSKELIHFLLSNVGEQEVRALDRYPRMFEQFTLDGLGGDPVAGFEALADRLMARYGDVEAPDAPLAREALVKLDTRGHELAGPLRALKRRIAWRRRLAALGLIEKAQPATAVRACMRARLVIWNPAGEIRPTPTSVDHVVRLLLLLRIAQRQGRRTAVINHSLEVGDARLRKLVAHVYSRADYVGLRDAKSIATARELGVPAGKLVESPDLVFLAAKRPGAGDAADVRPGTIALAINGLEAMVGSNEWERLIKGLAAFGQPLLLVSNAMNHDLDFARFLATMAPGVQVVERQPGYQELRGLYRPCSVLVSSRLHASVLALSEGVPVVSIEPSVFKLTAIFQQMEYPIPTERLQVSGWASRVLAHVETCLSDQREDLRARGAVIMERQLGRVEAAYAPLFALATSEFGSDAGGIGPMRTVNA
ncbi:polysaccharide pyruvyl transferase family protein [Novosphingobium resinovorum]|uniref:polysaccharide pyruvyl transferase family protein n=1 Tax=Novosphingobium resinovorum TaxID=158500 RepID=UPI002ED1BBC5|nr:polysaccharide pyruvyl transferase family protein [Novosphingobium resinovorum]